MKIGPLTNALGYHSAIHDRKDGQSPQQDSPRHPHKENPPNHQKDNASDPEELPVSPLLRDATSPEKLDQLVKDYHSDLHGEELGLTASVVGTGPGLKVVLKDNLGSIVRQFSKDEFLRLRDESIKDGRNHGKILDQKL